jgi:hypothetical protein
MSRATPLPVQTIRGITARASPDALWMASLTLASPVLRFSLLAGAKSMRARNARSAADGSRDRPSGLNSGRTPTKLDFAVIPREGSGYAEREHRQSARKAR